MSSLLFSGSYSSGTMVFFYEYNNHMPTYIGNKDMEFNFLMLQLLKLIKINNCQLYKSHFNTVYIFALPDILWLVAKTFNSLYLYPACM